jgi:dTDP-4-amino-4,6-dideoxygalactose transaminase
MKKIKFHKINYNNAEYNAALNVMKSGWLTMGPKSQNLERIFKKKLKASRQKNALVVSSCTTALHLCLIALGVGNGDEVICPSLTFVADANAIKYTGAKPIFCDIKSENDLTISYDDIKRKITKKTKVIILVHYAGFPCDLDKIKKIAKKNNIKILEDSCHSLFSSYKKKKLGNFGDLSVFSFYSNKNITSGEGGMIFGKNRYINKIKILRNHGIKRKNFSAKMFNSNYDVINLGYNYRLNEISCAILIEQLKKIDKLNVKRKNLAIYYKNEIDKFLTQIKIPFKELIGGDFSYHIFPIILPREINRNKLSRFLKNKGVETTIHYKPITNFKYYKTDLKFDNLDKISNRLISLPLYPDLKKTEVSYIIKCLVMFFKKNF